MGATVGAIGLPARGAALVERGAMKKPSCPTCKGALPPREKNAWFPFCSDRCKVIDLGRWFGGSYAVPGPPADPATREFLEEEEPKGKVH